jgi:hypothetical protein
MEAWLRSAAVTLKQQHPGATIIEVVRRERYMNDDPSQRAAIAATPNPCAIYFGSPGGSLNLLAASYCAELERAGVPSVLVVPAAFASAMHRTCEILECPLTIVTIEEDETDQKFVSVIGSSLLNAVPALHHPQSNAERIRIDSQDAADLANREGWSDGLPVFLPTEAAVEAMLQGTRQDPNRIVSSDLGPYSAIATVRLVAANAVLAGAQPHHLPLLLAATEALSKNTAIRPMLSSVNGFCFPFLVNGPIRARSGLDSGSGTIGALAHRAVERSIGLIIQNLADVRANETAFATQGNPAGPSFLIVENEEASPWPSFARSRGCSGTASSLTLFGGGWSHVGTYFYPEDGVEALGAAIARFEMPHSVLVLLSPARARMLARGPREKAEVAEEIRLNTTMDLNTFRGSGYFAGRIRDRIIHEKTWPAEYLDSPGNAIVPAYPPGGIKIVVAGGEGAPIMTAWKLEELATTSPDDWQ